MISDFRVNRGVCAATILLLSLNGCAGKGPLEDLTPKLANQRIGELSQAILGLGDDVDAGEARQAATIAIRYSRQLAREYEITDSALVHNLKINLGLKQRGLCVDWTRDLLARLRREKFDSLELHWAIANYEKAFRLEHSTVIISARGKSLQQGVVLDPWRNTGNLYWTPALQDPGYRWMPRAQIHALKREIEAANNRRN